MITQSAANNLQPIADLLCA